MNTLQRRDTGQKANMVIVGTIRANGDHIAVFDIVMRMCLDG